MIGLMIVLIVLMIVVVQYAMCSFELTKLHKEMSDLKMRIKILEASQYRKDT